MALPPLIQRLLEPASYPERPPEVTLLQTHISYIFLTPTLVYKVKKPVDFGFLDFTTLDRRLHFCREEVRLNRRLAPDVYLGVVAIVEKDGSISVEGEGEPVEYAVKMRRLDSSTILEEMLRKDRVTEGMIERVAERIVSFHRGAETGPRIEKFGSPEVIEKNARENFSQTEGFKNITISERTFEVIRDYTEGFLRKESALFLGRVQGGFIRDCHGDIHSEHISITDGIDIFDCIEFNERFRYSDTVADEAFLSMDLDFHNRRDLSKVLDAAYFRGAGDREGIRLLDFYKCYRAYVRGKVEGFKLREPEVPEPERRATLLKARHHFHLARLYATGGFRPMLVIVRGLPGTGKTVLSKRLSRVTRFIHLSSDVVRKELSGVRPGEHRFESYKKGIYSEDFTERTYRALLKRGGELLSRGRSVVLDATFSERRFIDWAKDEALGAGSEFHVIECASSDEVVRGRLSARFKGEGTASDAGWEVYLKKKEDFEVTAEPRLILDTGAIEDPEELVMKVSEKIFN